MGEWVSEGWNGVKCFSSLPQALVCLGTYVHLGVLEIKPFHEVDFFSLHRGVALPLFIFLHLFCHLPWSTHNSSPAIVNFSPEFSNKKFISFRYECCQPLWSPLHDDFNHFHAHLTLHGHIPNPRSDFPAQSKQAMHLQATTRGNLTDIWQIHFEINKYSAPVVSQITKNRDYSAIPTSDDVKMILSRFTMPHDLTCSKRFSTLHSLSSVPIY